MAESDATIGKLRGLLEASRRGVVFTGAGISTESGIPDFRSPGGIWSKYQPVEFDDFLRSTDMRREFWRRKSATHGTVQDAEPSRGHRAVAELVRRGRVSSVITQNIDGLHQRSGVPDEKVIELHGNTTYAHCLECGERHELGPIKETFDADESLPTCRLCRGLVKTATVSFGEPMPEEAMRRAEEETLGCDLFLATGSSLRVYPAAAFPALAKRGGARLVILNREPTEIDTLADLVVNREIGPTLGTVVGID